MASGVGLLNPKVTFFDDNGDPLSAGTVTFELPGTGTPLDSYSDADLTIPNSNPVVLDAAGRATIFLNPRIGYKITVQDYLGNTIYTQDNITEPTQVLSISVDGTQWVGQLNGFSSQIGSIGDSLEGHTLHSTLGKAASGTHPFFSGLVIYAPTITGSGATVAIANTLTLVGAPTGGTANYALYVTAGATQLNGALGVAGILTAQDRVLGTTFDGTMLGFTHGMTTLAPNDIHTRITVGSAITGGARIFGFSKADTGITLSACVTTAVTAPPTTASIAPFVFSAGLKTGTTIGTLGANKLIMVIQDSGTTRFAFDSDGDSFEDTGSAWTNYDDHDDLVLLDSVAMEVSRADDPYKDAIRRQFAESLTEMIPRAELERMRFLSGSLLNKSKLAMLHTGALRQIGRQMRSIAARLDAIGA